MTEKTSDALKILQKLIYEGRPERIAGLEKARREMWIEDRLWLFRKTHAGGER